MTLERQDIFLALLIVLIGFGGFGLGRLSKIAESREAIRIIEPKQSAAAASTQGEGRFVGSINSDKYHYPWCSGAGRISEKNKVWFATREEAQTAGYVPAGNCKGL